MHESESEIEVAQSCPTLSDLRDCSLPGSSIHGIFQARVLEWGAMTWKRMENLKASISLSKSKEKGGKSKGVSTQMKRQTVLLTTG